MRHRVRALHRVKTGALTYGGQHDSEVTFEITLESAGEITFTAL